MPLIFVKHASTALSCTLGIEKSSFWTRTRRTSISGYPPYLLAKRDQISPVHFADIVLSYLLAEHGGTWMDTTVFFTGSIDHITSDLPFFAFIRPGDPMVLSSWFIHSAAGYPLMCAMRDILTDYWKTNEVVPNYHYFHFLFECAITLHAELRQAWEAAPLLLSGERGFPRLLQTALNVGLSEEIFQQICRRTPVHKLSWKLPQAALADAKKLPEFVSRSRLIGDNEKRRAPRE